MKRLFLALLALVVVLAGAGWFYLDRLASGVVERGGSAALGVPVTVESMALSPFAGRLGINGLRVANPAGFSSEPLFRLDAGAVELRPTSLFADVIEIPSLTLDGLGVRVERQGSGTNLDHIIERLGGGSGDAGSGGGPGGQAPRLRVDYLRITGVEAGVDLGPEVGERGRFTLEVPPIELRGLGEGPEGITVAGLVERIAAAVSEQVERAVEQRVGRELEEAAGEAVEREKQDLERRLREEADKLLGQ